jgi:hypothetical protein
VIILFEKAGSGFIASSCFFILLEMIDSQFDNWILIIVLSLTFFVIIGIPWNLQSYISFRDDMFSKTKAAVIARPILVSSDG